MRDAPRIKRLDVSVYRVPTDAPESDGTLEWSHTTLVLVQAQAGDTQGLGYTYADESAAGLIKRTLAPLLSGRPAFDIPSTWTAMQQAVRNVGRHGLASRAISAVDIALWDLKARLLDLPLAALLGQARDEVPAYGSGGFTSYSDAQMEAQLGGWAGEGFRSVKMKIGRDPADDPRRVRVARRAVGPDVDLFVDANGALSPREALELAQALADEGVSWFEEPVSSDDHKGLCFVRERLPGGMRLAAGEYASDPWAMQALLEAGAVDVLQADATRCGGVTGFLRAAALCEAWHVPLSAHTAPSVHLHPCCAATCALAPLEWFHDHVRIEGLFFDGAPVPQGGVLRPREQAPGLGLTLRRESMERFQIR